MTTLLTVLGTRPEIIKLSPVLPLLERRWNHVLVHTGQHYDHALDGVFFEELRLRAPDVRLGVGSGSHGEQTARMLTALEPILQDVRPDAVIVQGDTNSTLAGALAASKLNIPVVHLEAGCRSFNRRMPEELNRVLVDHCSDLLLAADTIAERNLIAEGITHNVHLAGSTAIDACLRGVRFANSSAILHRLRLQSRGYLVATIHRAENTQPDVLPDLVGALNTLAREHPLVVPLHPRTHAAMQAQHLRFAPEAQVIEPLGYLDMLQLLRHANAVLTDSGGLQEEAAALNVPVLVLRDETEWMYLVEGNKAVLTGNRPEIMLPRITGIMNSGQLGEMRRAPCKAPHGAAQRIVEIIDDWLAARTHTYAQIVVRPAQALALGA